jgi:succinyl-diaminopimelate desuccinylase
VHHPATIEAVITQVDAAADEAVAFAADLIRIPTVNPPGDAYDECAHAVGDRLLRCGFEVAYHTATQRAEHTTTHPRVNVVGVRPGRHPRPCLHLNGHIDVVPPGDGWTRDPFGGVILDGRLYGRGAADMKTGLVAAIYATEAVRRAGIMLDGTVEISGTVDEESGGEAGVAWLAEQRVINAARPDYVIIPEPFGIDRICVGHRGVYWAEIVTTGRVAHGSMPFLGVSAVEPMAAIVERFRTELRPSLAAHVTVMPVVPSGARHATLNVNTIEGGQSGQAGQTPCVPDRCRLVVDRRFLIEESLDDVRQELRDVLDTTLSLFPGVEYTLEDRLVVEPVQTADEAPVVEAVRSAVSSVVGRDAELVASPGTYDHKHVTRIAGITQCVAYGPGRLELAHQPDEWCDIEDFVSAMKVLALATLRLVGAPADRRE